ncbi:hypothetical protein C8R46DRAFT_1065734 [Mycena filopes]|nr:hypothetical protein C8R46DRAFT_1065734 [Mycena filopes]
MNSDAALDDSLDIAEATLAQAFAQAKTALVEARKNSKLTIALAASEERCRTLQDELVDERVYWRGLQAQMEAERDTLNKQAEELKVAKKRLARDQATLREGQDALEAAQKKLASHKRAVVTNLKRSAAEMEGDLQADRRPVRRGRPRIGGASSPAVAKLGESDKEQDGPPSKKT